MALVFGIATGTAAFAQINATATITGHTDALNFAATVAPEPQFIGNGKLYFVMLHGSQFYFLSETRGFIAYTGGETPEFKTINRTTESVNLPNWNTRGQLGAAIFVGYGADFFEMLNSGRFKQISTISEITPRAIASNAKFYCNNPYQYITTDYVTYSFKLDNQTSHPISEIYFDLSLSIPGKPIPITQSSYYKIPGGVAPNSSIILDLQPNMFSDFATQAKSFCNIAGQTSLGVNIKSIKDAQGIMHTF